MNNLSPDDWVTLQAIVTIAQSNFSITDAKDWPMFMMMMKVVTGFLSAIIALALYIWWDLKKSIQDRRAEDATSCHNCKTDIWSHIDGPLWKAITDCCGFMTHDAQEKFRRRIKKYTNEVSDEQIPIRQHE